MGTSANGSPDGPGVITVTASRSYEVIVGENLLKDAGSYIFRVVSPAAAVIVSDDNVAPLYGQAVAASLEKEGISALLWTFPHGEDSKNASTLFSLLEFMAEHGITRSDLIIALGGGVTGDMAGFAASIYLRGIPYVQIPTSLLAAVDSSVGGKTAVDLNAGKNLAGTFYQPRLVLCDIRTLDTLPDSEFSCGMAEVIKYGVLCDTELFDLVKTGDARRHLDFIIRRCVSIKRDLVKKDEYDTGSRQLLNLGHTLGHAVEKLSHYTTSHGNAVGIGMVAIARCAYAAGLAPSDCSGDIAAALSAYGLPTSCPYETAQLCEVIRRDKKRSGQGINLVIPRQIVDTYLYRMDIDQLEDFFGKCN